MDPTTQSSTGTVFVPPASLKEAGVLTEEEFQAEKKRILEGN